MGSAREPRICSKKTRFSVVRGFMSACYEDVTPEETVPKVRWNRRINFASPPDAIFKFGDSLDNLRRGRLSLDIGVHLDFAFDLFDVLFRDRLVRFFVEREVIHIWKL